MTSSPAPVIVRAGLGIGLASAIVASVAGPAASFATARPTDSPPPSVAAAGDPCTAGYSPTLALDAKGEKGVDLPYSLDYRPSSASLPAGQGENPSTVGYQVTVTSPSGAARTSFGVDPTDVEQGVPWASTTGVFQDGRVPAWALDAGAEGDYRVTITYDKPVFGMRTAVTDLDNSSESITMNAFTSKEGGSAIRLDDEVLSSPTSIPSLASDRTHSGNTAYVVDGSKVRASGANGYANASSGGVDDSSASVFFAYDSDTPVQRLEMTYHAVGAGFWFVPPSIAQACVQPSVAISEPKQGGVGTLTSTIANSAGNGRVEGIGYTYRLPEGARVADDPNLLTGCGAHITAVPGAKEITVVDAAIASGANSCAWEVDVQFTGSGSITFDSSALVDPTNLVVQATKPVTVDIPADIASADASLRAEADGTPALGSALSYVVTVRNTGNAPLTVIDAADDRATGLVCAGLPLAVGATTECASTKPTVLSQEDVDAGRVDNDASLTLGTAFGGAGTARTGVVSTTIPTRPALTAAVEGALHSGGEHVVPGDTVSYTARLTNSGDTTLSAPGAAGVVSSCDSDVVAPGAEVACALPDGTVTQADIDAGAVTASFELTATAPDSTPVSAEAPVTVPLSADAAAALSARYSIDAAGEHVAAGDTVTTSTTVRNTGNVTLSDLAVTGPDGQVSGCAVELSPGTEATCASTHVLTQAEIDSGSTSLFYEARATAPNGDAVNVRTSVSVLLEAAAGASLSAHSAVEQLGERVAAGDTVTTTAAVENTGNVTLTELTVTGRDVFDCPSALAPGARVTCTVTHALTQSDVDAGTWGLHVTGTATTPEGDRFEMPAADTEAVLEAAPASSLDLHAAVSTGDDGRLGAGDRVQLGTTVHNDGNVTLHDTVLHLDRAGDVLCPGPIAPGEDLACPMVDVTLTQDDLERGNIEFIVRATTTTPVGATHEVSAHEISVALTAEPGIVASDPSSIVRSGGAVVGPGADGTVVVPAGATAEWRMRVQNTGERRLGAIAAVSDELDGFSCEADTLEPGESTTCTTAPYEITSDDLEVGVLTRTFHAEATVGSSDHPAPRLPLTVVSDSVRDELVISAPVEPSSAALAFTGIRIGGALLAALVLVGLGIAVSVTRRRAMDE